MYELLSVEESHTLLILQMAAEKQWLCGINIFLLAFIFMSSYLSMKINPCDMNQSFLNRDGRRVWILKYLLTSVL